MNTARFRQLIWRYYRAKGRHDLPWRKVRDPYRILVSEIMLQQTQVDRVVPFYKNFIKQFPTVQKLSEAPLSEVLKCWQGLGYNRRAKMLHSSAKVIMRHGMPSELAGLEQLPGVGPYTARAVVAFSFNQDVVVIETNIRTAIIHHFFPHKGKVSDKEIEGILAKVLPRGKSREWYGALMDYGAHLKRLGASRHTQSAHHTKQSKFIGSLREIRGAIIRELARAPATKQNLMNELGHTFGKERHTQFLQAFDALCYEGLIEKKEYRYRLTE